MDETTNKRYRKHPIDLREDQQHNMTQREAEQRGKRVLLGGTDPCECEDSSV